MSLFTDAEGGSDSWDRPPLPRINASKDGISVFFRYEVISHYLLACSLSADRNRLDGFRRQDHPANVWCYRGMRTHKLGTNC
jgi:hypothetical protein